MNNHPLQKCISELDESIENAKNEIEKLKKTKLEYCRIMMNDILDNNFDDIVKNYSIYLIEDFYYYVDKNKNKISFETTGKTFVYHRSNITIKNYIESVYHSVYSINYFRQTYLFPYSEKYTNHDCYILHSQKYKFYFIINKMQYDKMLDDIK